MFHTDNNVQAGPAVSIKKSTLAVSLALGLGGLPTAPNAALSTSVLNFTLGVPGIVDCFYAASAPPCNFPAYQITDIVGSYFSMDTDDSGAADPLEKTPIESLNGISIGTSQAASGSHSGSINGSETPNIDKPWTFFGGTGMHQTLSDVTDLTGAGAVRTMDFSGWNVTWNGIPSIPLTETANTTITCETAACSGGENYTIDGAFHVAGAGFTTVAYTLHLDGIITSLADIPTVEDDAFPDIPNTIKNNPVTLDVLDNDLSATGFIFDSLAPSTPTTGGGTAAKVVTNSKEAGYTEVLFTPLADFSGGTDAFTYTIANTAGTSDPATVTVDVQDNVAPAAVDDSLTSNVVALANAGGSLTKNVIENDDDDNNDPEQPGGIALASLAITGDATIGTCTANTDGTITYSQTAGTEQPAMESCTYTISDLDVTGAGGLGLASAVDGTLSIVISDIASDWPADNTLPFGGNAIPILFYEAGVPGNKTTDLPLSGSFFGMKLAANPPNNITYTTMTPGPSDGMVIGYEQPTGNSHGGAPDGLEETGLDLGWNFFGNTGFTKTANGGIKGNGVGDPPGTLRFGADSQGAQGRYIITWNGIPNIDLGGDTDNFPEDLGFGTINCDIAMPVDPAKTADCKNGDFFELEYEAHVPLGDPSNFGGVPYTLFLKGTVGIIDGTFDTNVGTIDDQVRMTASETGVVDPGVVIQCAGSCIDYSISEVPEGGQVKLVVPLTSGVPLNPVWRILDGGVWRSFDTTSGDDDTVKSAPLVPGDTECPVAGDPAYVVDAETDKPIPGHLCIELTITDDGPNDLNTVDVGVVADASGLGSGGAAGGGEVSSTAIRGGDSSGCSVSESGIKPQQRSEWWLLAGFVAWLGWSRRKKQQH